MACSFINTRLQLQVIVLIKIYFKSIELVTWGQIGPKKIILHKINDAFYFLKDMKMGMVCMASYGI